MTDTTITLGQSAAVAVPKPQRWRGLRRLMGHRSFALGFCVLAIIIIAAIIGPILSPYDPSAIAVTQRFISPNGTYWFGTDNLGRDVFTRVVYGAQISLTVGLSVVLLNAILGVFLGCVSGFYRSLDGVLMRIMDALMAFPAILLAVGIAAALGAGVVNVIIALTITYVPRTARIVRASVLVIRSMEYIDAARSISARDSWIIVRHVIPNSLAPLLVQLTVVFAYAVLSEAALSFLGVGPPPPTPSWGSVVSGGQDYIVDAWWISFFPGVVITVTVLALNLMGDGLRDVLDPRMRID
jgi:peptide/nickel transport system permease protein